MRAGLLAVLMLLVGGCARGEPPGAEPRPTGQPTLVSAGDSELASGPKAGKIKPIVTPGSVHDQLPFEPSGKKLASIAWRTWVYTDTGPRRTRYGYLRAGQVVDVREPGLGPNEGCKGGWWRINPRGFVCVGKGATLEHESSALVTALQQRAERGKGLPYIYALSRDMAPHLYFQLPTASDMQRVEGEGWRGHANQWRANAKINGVRELLGEEKAPPGFLTGTKLTKPYGVKQQLHYSVHAGRAAADSGFALMDVFDHEDRTFGLTTELDLIALDRTRVVKPSVFKGVELGEGEDLPVAFVDAHQVQKYERQEGGAMKRIGHYPHRMGIKLTGRFDDVGVLSYHETREGDWITHAGVKLLKERDQFPSFAKARRKWIDISIKEQTLVAYEGTKAVYATLVSTGRGGLGDPEKVHATVRGTFMIHAKHVTTTMDGDDDKSDSFNLRDVPFVQYFHKGYALHGTYWHDEFGKVRSHGCVNLSPTDAAWLFEWTDPQVPSHWHATLNKARGTVVYIHP